MTTKKSKSRKTTLDSRQLARLGETIGQGLIQKIFDMAAARGISFPLEFSNVDAIKREAVQALEKAKHLKWDLLSWDRQDSFTSSFLQTMRDAGIVK